MENSKADAARVAVIVVHGVADQVAGSTARSAVELLVTSPPRGTSYEAIATDEFALAVSPLPPASAPARRTRETPTSESRPLFKAFAQSIGSDFHRAGWEAPQKAGAAGAWSAALTQALPPGDEEQAAAEPDRGLQLTSYLLAKYRDNGAAPEAYDSTVVALKRSAQGEGGPQRVDVYEMYWADLSRLSGAIPRIVTELFTMLFRLSKLGRGTVNETLRHVKDTSGKTPFSWRCLAALQTGLDWAFVNVLALLFAQLAMLALVIAPFAVAAPHEQTLRWVVGGGVLVFAILWSVYRRRDAPQRLALPLALVAIGAAMLLSAASVPWLLAALWLALLTLALNAALRVSDDRFPFTRACGLLLWTFVLAAIVAAVLGFVVSKGSPAALAVWVQAALFGVELALWAIKWWWVVAAVLFAAWFGAGFFAARHGGYEGSASVGTGRLGLFVSLGTFVMLTMALWALASTVLEVSVAAADIKYVPRIFPIEENTRGTSDAAEAAAAYPLRARPATALPDPCACVAPIVARDHFAAEAFLRNRYEDSTSFFSVIAALLLLLVFYLAAMFLPSVLAELKLLTHKARAAGSADGSAAGDAARRLGRWLTAGYRRLTGAVSGVVVLGIVGAVLVGLVLAFGWARVAEAIGAGFIAFVAYYSQALLKPLVLSAAGIAAALTAFGGVLSRYLPGLRTPLDIALDVDNHFREFPRKSIPRARIFSRYAALLGHIAQQGYARIVIVSHSQGTVISAELLRFLSDAPPGTPRRGHDRRTRLRDLFGCDVRLLTLGSPLRQLYAARFPSLYGWVLRKHGAGNGPTAADIGAERWANAFTSGDYVGRWLWSSPAAGEDALGHPMVDTVHPPVLGRTDAYSLFEPMPPAAHPLATAAELEVCLGLGAHTHYLDPDQANVAWLINYLITAAPLGAGNAAGDAAPPATLGTPRAR